MCVCVCVFLICVYKQRRATVAVKAPGVLEERPRGDFRTCHRTDIH